MKFIIQFIILASETKSNTNPLGCSFYSPQSTSAFKIQDGDYSVRSPKKYACVVALQATTQELFGKGSIFPVQETREKYKMNNFVTKLEIKL